MILPTQKNKTNDEAQNAPETTVNAQNGEVAQNAEIVENESLPATLNAPSAEIATIDNEEMFKSFESVPDEALNEATSGYFTPEEGEVYNFITTGIEIADGFKDDEGNPKEQEVAVLYDRDKRKLISASAVLVNTVRQLFAKTDKKAILIRVFCEGKEKIKGGGFYFKLKIKTL